MKLIQYKGSFSRGQTFTVKPQVGYRYVHIGFQAPYREPIGLVNESALPEDFEIEDSRKNKSTFHINDTDILEFDGLTMAGVTIRILRDLPFGSTIDIMYTVEEDY